MKTLILGMGEIGSSLFEILKDHYSIWGEDVKPELRKMSGVPKQVEILHICIRYTPDFLDLVSYHVSAYKPWLINVCSTVPPGTTEQVNPTACHSTTRGLHPNLVEGLKTITKHIGGPKSDYLKSYFSKVGIPSISHPKAKTTELLHILNNCHYGVNLMFADEAYKMCRQYGVDYYDWMKYGESNNDGYMAMGHKTKVRPILTPPGGSIGGHCVNMSAGLIPENKRTKLIDLLSKYG